MTSLRVAHAGADYEVLVGDFAAALPALNVIAQGRRLPVISDQRVFNLYGRRLSEVALAEPILVPEGEAAKDWGTLSTIVGHLANLNIKRGTPVIALGGGSIGDVAGLAASLFKRGCPIIHIPTTLLAQADSAIGGKTAIDAAGQKNLVGTFHHPLLVIADPSLLHSLDARQLRSGYAEVVKYGLIDNPGFFSWCEANHADLLQGGRASCQTAIEHCVQAKARIVAADPHDTDGIRALLNLGHTFGHAIEVVAGDAVLHGEAVALGMSLAFEFSVHIACCQAEDAARVRTHFRIAGLPTNLEDVGLDNHRLEICNAMLSDKKADRDGLVMILARGIGAAFVAKGVELERLSEFLDRAA